MTAIGECAAQNSPPTKSRSLREKLFGPRRDDIRPDCGALVMLATEAETANV